MDRYREGLRPRSWRTHSAWRLIAPKKRDCLRQVDAAVIQRPADDRTARAEGRHRFEVCERRNAAGSDDVRIDLLDQLAEALHVGPAQRAVTSNIGINELAYTALSETLCHVNGVGIGLSEPAISR